MAKVRKKSINQISFQQQRMITRLSSRIAEAGGAETAEGQRLLKRMSRVSRTGDKYIGNIAKSPQWKNAFKSGYEFAEQTDFMPSHNSDYVTAGYGNADNTKVSSRIYMGLVNG